MLALIEPACGGGNNVAWVAPLGALVGVVVGGLLAPISQQVIWAKQRRWDARRDAIEATVRAMKATVDAVRDVYGSRHTVRTFPEDKWAAKKAEEALLSYLAAVDALSAAIAVTYLWCSKDLADSFTAVERTARLMFKEKSETHAVIPIRFDEYKSKRDRALHLAQAELKIPKNGLKG